MHRLGYGSLGHGPFPKESHGSHRPLAPVGRLGPDVGPPWAPGPAPLRGQGLSIAYSLLKGSIGIYIYIYNP